MIVYGVVDELQFNQYLLIRQLREVNARVNFRAA